jgi:hypothetical protein
MWADLVSTLLACMNQKFQNSKKTDRSKDLVSLFFVLPITFSDIALLLLPANNSWWIGTAYFGME